MGTSPAKESCKCPELNSNDKKRMNNIKLLNTRLASDDGVLVRFYTAR